MHTDFLLDTFSKNRNNEAIIWKEKSFDYQWLFDRFHTLKKEIKKDSHECEKDKIKINHHVIKGNPIESILKYSKAKKMI